MKGYVGYLQKSGKYSPYTINRKITAISSFLRYAVEKGVLPEHPLKEGLRVDLPHLALASKSKVGITHPFSYDPVMPYVLMSSLLDTRAWYHARNKAVIALLLITGIAPRYLTSPPITSHSLDNRKGVFIHPGTGRKVFLPDKLVAILREYIALENEYGRSHNAKNAFPVFLHSPTTGMVLSAYDLSSIVRNVGIRLGLDKQGELRPGTLRIIHEVEARRGTYTLYQGVSTLANAQERTDHYLASEEVMTRLANRFIQDKDS
jgi:integrase